MIDETHFPGDDSMRGYDGQVKEFLFDLQLNLRHIILSEDEFPKSTDFERAIKFMFEAKAQEALQKKGETSLLLTSEREHMLILASSPQREARPNAGHTGACEYSYYSSFTEDSDIVSWAIEAEERALVHKDANETERAGYRHPVLRSCRHR